MKITITVLLLLGSLGLTACGSSEEAAPAQTEQPATTEQQPAVPEDNVFHDQVEALNKAKEAKKLQEQQKEAMDQAIEEQTGGDSSNPPRT